MSHWNYRVIHRRHAVPKRLRVAVDHDFEDTYAVHEVYYDDAGKPTACSEEPSPLLAETLPDLQEERMKMAMALRLPALEWDTFGASEPAA